MDVQNQMEDKFLRATKFKYYRSEESIVENNTKQPSQKKTRKKLKALSFVFASVVVASALIIPTTTLAPDVNAFEDSKAASYSIGNLDDFSVVITENCVPKTTVRATEATTEIVEKATNKAEETEPEVTEEVTEVETEAQTETFTETEVFETYDVQSSETEDSESTQYFVSENSNDNATDNSYVEESNSYESSGSYLISIDNPDYSYSPRSVSLSEYDRAKLERLVMGEAGTMGFNGCALVAQAIRDAMNRSNTSSIDTIISTYQYYAPTNKEPNQDVKNAVSYIFDQNGSAVQHRVLVFYTGTSGWHETQIYITTCGNVRFFDMR